MSKIFSENLKYLRKLKKISQQQLADKLNIDRSTISRWESNDIDPTVSNVISIANLLGIPVADLVGRDIREEDLLIDELETLFLQNKHLLTDDDRDTIKFIIEKRVKENNGNT
jgi:transcriptional regulator with XRE-family HTH domain